MKILIIICLTYFNFYFSIIIAQAGYPPCAAYDTVGKDTLKACNSYSNVLYAGVDNYIEINKANINYKNIFVECTHGMAMEDEDKFIVIPAKTGFALLNVYEFDGGDTSLVFQKSMKVLKFPQPYITLDNIKLTDNKNLSKEKLIKYNRFQVHLSDDFIDDSEWYKIKEITMGYPMGQQYITLSSEGNLISGEMLLAIQKLMSGKELSFTFTLVGSGGLYKRIPPVRVNIY